MEMQTRDVGAIVPGRIVAGGILLLAGMVMFLDSTGFAEVHVWRSIGPLVLIAFGANILSCRGNGAGADARAHRRHRHLRTNGIWLIGVGLWLLVSQNHVFGLDFHSSWPLLIMLGGVITVIRGLK
jgi:hypothetical protein